MINQEKVKALLGSGLNATIVAQTVGCEVSYISQLMADESFASQVVSLRTKDLVKYKELDNKYDNLEEKLLQKLEDLIPMITRPRDVLSALTMVNGAKRKSAGINTSVETGEVVRLSLPTTIVNNYTVNLNGNMVRVEGRDLAPMPSSILMKTLEDKMKGNHDVSLPLKKEAEIKQLGNMPGKNLPSIPSERIVNAQQI